MAFDPRSRNPEIERAIREVGVPLIGGQQQAIPPRPSDYKCPVCGDIPSTVGFPNNFGVPADFPAAHITQIAGEAMPTFSCNPCQIRFLRKYVPTLVSRKDDDVPVADLDEDDDAPTDQ